MGLSITEEALLTSVVEGTPAERAGLRTGDVIIAIESTPVDDLVSLLPEYVAGEAITLEVLRNGQTFHTQLPLGERA